MKAGDRPHLVIFEAKTIPETQNSYGEPVEVWAEAFRDWAAFEPAGSREFPMAHKRFAESTARFRVLYRSELGDPKAADKYRIVMTIDPYTSPVVTSTWNITTPQPAEGRRIEMHIEASEFA